MVASFIQANESTSLIAIRYCSSWTKCKGERGLFRFTEYPAASHGVFGEGKYAGEREKTQRAYREAPSLARIIHDGSSSPSLTLPHTMGEGEGGGAFLVKRISLFARDLREKRDGLDVSSSRVAPVAHILLVSLTIHERRFTRKRSESTIAAEPFIKNAG